jgi:hypothetical protein
MNWRRGLFRLWIVGSALFVLAVAFVSYSDIKKQFNDANDWVTVVPQLCGDARRVAGKDYAAERAGPQDKPNPFDNCWYEMPKFRRLYPEYNDLSDNELARKLYSDQGSSVPNSDQGFSAPTEPNPWATLGMWAAIAFGVPLVVLVLGSSLVWAFSGFAAKRP